MDKNKEALEYLERLSLSLSVYVSSKLNPKREVGILLKILSPEKLELLSHLRSDDLRNLRPDSLFL